MVTTPQDDAATLAMLKDMCPYHGRIWRAWDDLGRKGNRNGAGAVRLLDAPDGVGTMSAHTPGPWIAKPRSTGGYNICAVDDVLEDVTVGTAILDFFSFEEARDNARLMAAAPKLLAAVKALMSGDGEYEAVRMGHDAIAEAEGTP